MTGIKCGNCGHEYDADRPSRSADECPECGRDPNGVDDHTGAADGEATVTITVTIQVASSGDVDVRAAADE